MMKHHRVVILTHRASLGSTRVAVAVSCHRAICIYIYIYIYVCICREDDKLCVVGNPPRFAAMILRTKPNIDKADFMDLGIVIALN